MCGSCILHCMNCRAELTADYFYPAEKEITASGAAPEDYGMNAGPNPRCRYFAAAEYPCLQQCTQQMLLSGNIRFVSGGGIHMGIFDKFRKKEDEKEPAAYGWDAVTARFEQLYPGQTNPKHYGTLIKYRFGGNDPLDGISIYDGGDFWHFITYGFSDLYEKHQEDDPEWSGAGFELTLKLKKEPWIDESEIKNIAGILQSLARYAFSSQVGFRPYEYIWTKQTDGFDLNGKSKLTGFATMPDEAGVIETPHGKVEFICVVGLTDNELRSIYNKQSTTKEVLAKINSPITDYERDEAV